MMKTSAIFSANFIQHHEYNFFFQLKHIMKLSPTLITFSQSINTPEIFITTLKNYDQDHYLRFSLSSKCECITFAFLKINFFQRRVNLKALLDNFLMNYLYIFFTNIKVHMTKIFYHFKGIQKNICFDFFASLIHSLFLFIF